MPKARYIVRDGMRLRIGSPQWKWWRRNRRALHGQPPLKKPPEHTELERGKQVIAFAHSGLAYHGRMFYSETAKRSILFHRKPGNFLGATADCSQFVAAILHWVGVKTVTDTDYTGTLLQKGKKLGAARPGCVVIWGPDNGTHAAFISEKTTGDWWTIGFGHQGAPDRVLLSTMNHYFQSIGKPGVRFLDFLE